MTLGGLVHGNLVIKQTIGIDCHKYQECMIPLALDSSDSEFHAQPWSFSQFRQVTKGYEILYGHSCFAEISSFFIVIEHGSIYIPENEDGLEGLNRIGRRTVPWPSRLAQRTLVLSSDYSNMSPQGYGVFTAQSSETNSNNEIKGKCSFQVYEHLKYHDQ